jgi:RNA recognition motif-containing protein
MQASRLYVGNLNYSVNNDQLKELFAAYGEVKSINIIEGKGFGFVEMGSPAEAEAAREALNGSDFNGRTLRIDEARPPKARDDRGGGGGRGGDRGGDRRGGGGGFRRY